MRRSHLFVLLFGVLCVFTYTVLRVEGRIHQGFLEDDAYISLRNAKNLVEGHGLTYNPGERVEAYTNFSLTMLMALPYALGLDAVVFVKVLGGVSGASLIVTTGSLTKRVAGATAGAVVMLMLALDERLAWFATCGLETALVSALYMAAILLLTRGRIVPSALLFVAAALTRMETVLLFGVATAFLLSRCRTRADLRRPLRFSVAFVVPFGAYYIWRYAYYGWAFPNTYYAKVGSVSSAWQRGVDYLASCASSMHLWPALAASSVALLVGGAAYAGGRYRTSTSRPSTSGRARPSVGVLVAASCATYAAFAIAVGGDHFRERFVYHFYPLLLVTLAWAWRLFFVRTGLRARWPTTAPVAIAGVLAVLLAPVARTKVQFEPAWGMAAWKSVGQWLRVTAPANATVATDAAGVIALESNLRTIDVLGLADLHIAHLDVAMGSGSAGHEKSDPAYVLGRNPDYATTWIDADGHIGRNFRRYYRFWRDYELRGLVQKDVVMQASPDRIMRVEPDLTLEALVALRNGSGPVPGKWSWAIWERRKGPVPPRPFGRLDLGSQLQGAQDHPGTLMVAPRGHAPMHVVHGPGMVFPPGRYRVSYAMKIHNVDASAKSGEICKSDVWDGVAPRNEQTLTTATWTDRDAPLEATFDVTEEAASRAYEFRIFCFGVADVTVVAGDVTAVAGW